MKEPGRYRRRYLYMKYAYIYGEDGDKGRALYTHIHLISWHYMTWYRPGRGMPGRGMCIFMVKWIGCRRLGNMIYSILCIYVYVWVRKAKKARHLPKGTYMYRSCFYPRTGDANLLCHYTWFMFFAYCYLCLTYSVHYSYWRPFLWTLRFMPRRSADRWSWSSAALPAVLIALQLFRSLTFFWYYFVYVFWARLYSAPFYV